METKRFHFRPEEDEYLRTHYSTCGDIHLFCQQMHEQLGTPLRSSTSVHSRASILKLTRSPEAKKEAIRNAHIISAHSKREHVKRAKFLESLGFCVDIKLAMFSAEERRIRCYLKKKYSYILKRKDHTIYWDHNTNKLELTISFYQAKGYTFAQLPSSNEKD